VQIVLAERDMERRYLAPQRAALEAKEQVGG
jgi:hypothetical protein